MNKLPVHSPTAHYIIYTSNDQRGVQMPTDTQLSIALLAGIKMASWIAPSLIISWITFQVSEFFKPWRF